MYNPLPKKRLLGTRGEKKPAEERLARRPGERPAEPRLVRPGGLTQEEDTAVHRRTRHRWPEAARTEGRQILVHPSQRGAPPGRPGLPLLTERGYRHGSSRTEWIQPSERGTLDGTP